MAAGSGFSDSCSEDDFSDSAPRRLLLLKRAMVAVSTTMSDVQPLGRASSAGDQLGCAIRLLRAVETGRSAAVHKAFHEAPHFAKELDEARRETFNQVPSLSLRRLDRLDGRYSNRQL